MRHLIDLHIHSTFSDGALSPRALVELAKRTGLTAMSITDHDTVDGTSEALLHGSKQNIEILSGVEISAVHNEKILHILGYGFDPLNKNLLETIKKIQQGRRERNIRIVDKLIDLGKEISFDELTREKGKLVGRPHIAQLLVRKGYVKSIDEAFRRYLRDSGPAYVEGDKLSSTEAISAITGAGGITVLAHPAIINLSFTSLTVLIRNLASLGLAGLEVYYPGHSANFIKKIKLVAEQYNLLLTGGSDFHGLEEHGHQLGGPDNSFRLPYESWIQFKESLAGTQNAKDI